MTGHRPVLLAAFVAVTLAACQRSAAPGMEPPAPASFEGVPPAGRLDLLRAAEACNRLRRPGDIARLASLWRLRAPVPNATTAPVYRVGPGGQVRLMLFDSSQREFQMGVIDASTATIRYGRCRITGTVADPAALFTALRAELNGDYTVWAPRDGGRQLCAEIPGSERERRRYADMPHGACVTLRTPMTGDLESLRRAERPFREPPPAGVDLSGPAEATIDISRQVDRTDETDGEDG